MGEERLPGGGVPGGGGRSMVLNPPMVAKAKLFDKAVWEWFKVSGGGEGGTCDGTPMDLHLVQSLWTRLIGSWRKVVRGQPVAA